MRQAYGHRSADADRLLWRLADATAGLNDRHLYRALVSVLSSTLDVTFVAMTFQPPEGRRDDATGAVAVCARQDGRPSTAPVSDLQGTPCMALVDGRSHLCMTNLRALHPLRDDPVASDLHACPILDTDGAVLGEIAVFFASGAPEPRVVEVIDIFARRAATELRRARVEAELSRLAMTDPLTGVSNRRAFMAAADREVRRARRFRDPLSAVIIDLDHFKRINDTAGHAGGDLVLRGFAELATRTLRSIDVVGRIGGEEFALLLPGTPLPGATLTADRIRVASGTVVMPAGVNLPPLTISVGVAELSTDDSTAEALLERADVAMYRAKTGGRDRVVADVPAGAPASNGLN